MYPPALYSLLKRQKYHVVGGHSAVKACKWLHESLVRGRVCYKEKFYGIRSHRCIQASPAVMSCLTACRWCWRAMPDDVGFTWSETFSNHWDEPETLVEGFIREHRRILSGYGSQVREGRVNAEKFREALEPNQIAISLSGEPALYPKLWEIIRAFKERGFTVFLVTSGVLPHALQSLLDKCEPTQLYVSLTAPNRGTYLELNRPITPTLWDALQESLKIAGDFRCQTVMRITVIRGVNTDDESIRRFAEVVNRSLLNCVEVKAYMHIGFSTSRLGGENMPSFKDIQRFTGKLSGLTGYEVVSEDGESRVSLLTRKGKPQRFD